MRAEVVEMGGNKFVKLPDTFMATHEEIRIVESSTEFLIITGHPRRSAAGIYDALIGMPEDFFAEGCDKTPDASEPPSWDD